ncbi:MAG TPA: hypothetical protein VMD53_14630 [Rhizomicrobium sp.]|nr:hypothetical protein [Rhizomicrobium sp.]
MGKVLVSAAAGAVAASAVMAAFYFGVRVSPEILMMVAAALCIGAAVSVLTRVLVDTPTDKTPREKFLSKRIRDVKGLIDGFPKSDGAVQLSIRCDTVVDDLDIVKNPANYLDKDVVVTIKEAKDGNKTFNPVTLKRIFLALKQQPNFVHLILVDKHNEFVGYIPSLRVKNDFTGDDAEVLIARHIVDVFADHANSANLRAINGLAATDTISDEDHLSRALDKMQGGFLRLVVLKGGYHRKPVGLLHSERLVSATKAE